MPSSNSYTQTYKLRREAKHRYLKEDPRKETDLRRLVGHASVLKSLGLSLLTDEEEEKLWLDEILGDVENGGEDTGDTVEEEEHKKQGRGEWDMTECYSNKGWRVEKMGEYLEGQRLISGKGDAPAHHFGGLSKVLEAARSKATNDTAADDKGVAKDKSPAFIRQG